MFYRQLLGDARRQPKFRAQSYKERSGRGIGTGYISRKLQGLVAEANWTNSLHRVGLLRAK